MLETDRFLSIAESRAVAAICVTTALDMILIAIWLPQGEWYDFFDGRRYVSDNASGRRLEVWRALDRIPVFAKAGGIIPLQELATGDDVNDLRNPSVLHVLVFPVRTELSRCVRMTESYPARDVRTSRLR